MRRCIHTAWSHIDWIKRETSPKVLTPLFLSTTFAKSAYSLFYKLLNFPWTISGSTINKWIDREILDICLFLFLFNFTWALDNSLPFLNFFIFGNYNRITSFPFPLSKASNIPTPTPFQIHGLFLVVTHICMNMSF